MITLIRVEIKRYFGDIKKAIAMLVAAAFIVGIVYAAAATVAQRKTLIEPFEAGVVDNDGSRYTTLIFDVFNDTEGLGDMITLVNMSEAEAEKRLADGSIPAYLVIPEGFSRSVNTGQNKPFTVVGSRLKPIGLAVSRLLSIAGTAYLTASQCGIYAVMDFCYANGMERAEVAEKVTTPINYKYAVTLMNYKQFFDTKEVYVTGGRPVAESYMLSALVFFLILGMMVFLGSVRRAADNAVNRKLYIAGIGAFKAGLFRVAGLCTVVAAFTFWLCLFFGVNALALMLCLSCFVYMAGSVFRSEVSGSMFIFLTALVMLVLSGGVIPILYMPEMMRPLRYATINYWAIEGGGAAFVVLALYAAAFFGIGTACNKARVQM